jgi:hypothetical protein
MNVCLNRDFLLMLKYIFKEKVKCKITYAHTKVKSLLEATKTLYKQRYRQTVRQTNRQTVIQTYRHADRQTYRYTDRQTEEQLFKHKLSSYAWLYL